jgi:hypothetical protein
MARVRTLQSNRSFSSRRRFRRRLAGARPLGQIGNLRAVCNLPLHGPEVALLKNHGGS